MKRLFLMGLLTLLVLSLVGCGSNNNESSEKILKVGEVADFKFGTFTISGFKRDGETFYFSILINPKNSGSNTVDLEDFYYYLGDEPTKINNLSIELTGTQFQNLYTVTSDKTAEIDAMSLEYDGTKAKWDIDLSSNSGGDVNYIDSTLAQIRAEQERLQQEEQARKAAQEEKNNVAYAWQVVDEYGEAMYPYGFKLHYIMDKLAEEKRSDGTWFLKAGCDVTNMYNAKMSGVCEAVVQGSGKNWSIVSFNVY